VCGHGEAIISSKKTVSSVPKITTSNRVAKVGNFGYMDPHISSEMGKVSFKIIIQNVSSK